MDLLYSGQLTEKLFLSNCTNNEGFNPDEEMEKKISEHINCSLPWSSYKVQDLEDCKTESDFHDYLVALDHLQKEFKRIGKKCSYKTWKLFPISEEPNDGNGTTSIGFQVIWSTEDSITVEKEVYVYTIAYFIGTFGGYLGLFLGGSILGCLDSIESFIFKKIDK